VCAAIGSQDGLRPCRRSFRKGHDKTSTMFFLLLLKTLCDQRTRPTPSLNRVFSAAVAPVIAVHWGDSPSCMSGSRLEPPIRCSEHRKLGSPSHRLSGFPPWKICLGTRCADIGARVLGRAGLSDGPASGATISYAYHTCSVSDAGRAGLVSCRVSAPVFFGSFFFLRFHSPVRVGSRGWHGRCCYMLSGGACVVS